MGIPAMLLSIQYLFVAAVCRGLIGKRRIRVGEPPTPANPHPSS